MAYKKIKEPITEAHKSFLAEAQRLKEVVAVAKKAAKDFIKTCKHEAIEYHTWGKDDHGSATCRICESHLGWYCPESPDRGCHYTSEKGKVELSDGTLVDVPAGHDDSYETDDSCIFCGQPDERK
jgi:hypothetical protein